MEYKKRVKKYFSKNASAWVADQYKKQDYSYPAALNRIRIALKVIKKRFGSKKLNILDIGCGRGDFCIALAKLGHNITGNDQSEEMLSLAKKENFSHGEEIASRIKLVAGNFNDVELKENSFDVVISLGVFEYLTDENFFLLKVKRLLKPKGTLILDFRNRLFNMISISNYTIKEVQEGSAINLIKEIEELYHPLPQNKSMQFVKNLKNTVIQIVNQLEQNNGKEAEPSPKATCSIEGRQQTPNQVTAVAEKCGFINKGYYGVHPHLLIPKLNELLPPQIFNKLSDTLIAFEELPISLIWSSKFIGVFEKK